MSRKIIKVAMRVVGRHGNRVRRSGIILSLVMTVAADIALVKTVLAVHDTGLFQLDGEATSSTFLPGFPATDDWDKVCHQVNPAACPSGSNTTGAAAVSWTSETDPSASIFTGGGSKDPIDINQWAWKDQGGLPDKDNLLHAFASRYQKSMVGRTTPDPTCPNGTGPGTAYPTFDPTKPCDVLFFGSDRIDNSGDAQQGFWFFQNEISLASNSVGGGSGFSGVHKAGDLLIISDFSNGGTTSTITAYKWDPSCTATGKAINPNNPKRTIDDPSCGDANL